jgi:hypothetical protein
MNAIITSSAVELRLGEKRRCLAQDLIGAAQFSVLALERLEPFALIGGCAGALALVTARRTPRRSVSCVQPISRNRLHRRPLHGYSA